MPAWPGHAHAPTRTDHHSPASIRATLRDAKPTDTLNPQRFAMQFDRVLPFLDSRDAAALAASSNTIRAAVRTDDAAHYWHGALLRDFGVDVASAAAGTQQGHALWQAARAAFGDDAIGHLGRAVRVFDRLHAALQHFPAALLTLQPGAAPEAIVAAEMALSVRFPPALKALYAVHDGQLGSHPSRPTSTMFCGLFGGYVFYDVYVSTFFLPLSRVVELTTSMRRRGLHGSLVAFAYSPFSTKLFVISCDTGSVYAVCGGGRILRAAPPPEGVATSAEVPPADAAGIARAGSDDADMRGAAAHSTSSTSGARLRSGRALVDGDCVLRWVEEYASRLEAGTYRVRCLPGSFSDVAVEEHTADDDDDASGAPAAAAATGLATAGSAAGDGAGAASASAPSGADTTASDALAARTLEWLAGYFAARRRKLRRSLHAQGAAPADAAAGAASAAGGSDHSATHAAPPATSTSTYVDVHAEYRRDFSNRLWRYVCLFAESGPDTSHVSAQPLHRARAAMASSLTHTYRAPLLLAAGCDTRHPRHDVSGLPADHVHGKQADHHPRCSHDRRPAWPRQQQ